MTILTHDLASDYKRTNKPVGKVVSLEAEAPAVPKPLAKTTKMGAFRKLLEQHNAQNKTSHRHRLSFVSHNHAPKTKHDMHHATQLHHAHKNHALEYLMNFLFRNMFKLSEPPSHVLFTRQMFDPTTNVFQNAELVLNLVDEHGTAKQEAFKTARPVMHLSLSAYLAAMLLDLSHHVMRDLQSNYIIEQELRYCLKTLQRLL